MIKTQPSRSPTIRLEPRLEQPRWLTLASPFILVVVALFLGGVLLELIGADAWLVYGRMLSSAFGDKYGWSDTTIKATPLILTGLSVAVCARMNVWNIGAEGQFLFGAFMATGVALHWHPAGSPAWLILLLMSAAGFIGGALWILIPAVLRATMNVNEIITTLMLNYVAVSWNNFFIFGPWSERGFGLTPQFPKEAWFPRLTDYASSVKFFSGLTAHAGLLMALTAAVILWIALYYTKWGFEARIIGDNQRAARYAGINVKRNFILAMLLSGALAGLAGMSEVAGVVHRLQDNFSPGYGFTGIIVAWLAKLNPLAVVLVAYLFGGLLVGADQIQPAGVAQMLQGVILFVVVGGEMLLRYKIVWR